MTEPFYPPVEHEEHKRLKEQIREICQKLSARCIDLIGYYKLPESDRWFISRNFSHEPLWIRTLPDLYLCPAKAPGFFLDVKTKATPKYPNISIELSSFYWTFRRNMPNSMGIRCLHFYASHKMSEWQKYLSYNDNKKLLEDLDKTLPKIRSRAIKRLCVLYKMVHGLMPFYVVECSEDWSRARKKGKVVDPETIIKWLRCSERTAYDYYYALEFMLKCEELCNNLDYYIKEGVRERLGMCTRVREVKEGDE